MNKLFDAMKKVIFLLLTLCSLAVSAGNIDKIDPPCWYAGMKNTSLQLMVYGKNIRSAGVTVNYPGVKVDSIVRLESPNYLLVYLNVKGAKPGKMKLVFNQGKKKFTQDYELKARAKAGSEHKGFDMSDVLYLLMPDRFANGNPKNDRIKGMAEYKVDRNDPNARHGGDLKGVANHLDYFSDLGVTALWFTPVLENNMQGGSYHGYATTDYYKVDPRFGSNEEYRDLIASIHERGMKVIMDMIFNHCGSEHVWLKDMPSHDWFNHPDYKNNFVQTSYKLTPHVDPYASNYDFDKMGNGWFVLSMPDLNQRNPHVMRYLAQSSEWWIEYADINAIRMDTYPYADYDAMSQWQKELDEEYPNMNTVGETWCTEPAYTAWWQKDSKLSAPRNSYLKTVMDFSFFSRMNTAKNEETTPWEKGLDLVYNNFVYDFLYPDNNSILAFLENHDTDRFLGEGDNLPKLEQAVTLLLTTHRIPQLYYGTEVMMNGVKTVTDGYVRKDFPGGWTGDQNNAFTAKGRTDKQNECYYFYRNLLNWRKGSEVISKGTMKQFIVENGVYAYARQYNGKTIFVMLNGTDKEENIPMSCYKEVLNDATQGRDILSKEIIRWGETLKMTPRQSLVLEIN
jgi:glycosidase